MSSIRARLLLFLLPVTVVALAVTAVGIERAVRRDLAAARDRQLLLLAQGIAAVVELAVDGTPEFDMEDGDSPELERSARESLYAVVDEHGGVLFSSFDPPPGLVFPPADEPAFLDLRVGGRAVRACLLSIVREPERDPEDVEEWLEGHPERELPEALPRRLGVIAGLPEEELAGVMGLVRRRLALGFGLLSAALVVLPVWVAGLSLRPLRRLSRQADRVGAGQPDARLGELGVDREVRPLVGALNRALDRLAGAYAQQRRFTADAAHELRSPLSAIRTQCEVLLRRERDAAELREGLESVHRIVLRLVEVVEKLLSLSRLQSGIRLEEEVRVDLTDVAHEAAQMLLPLARSRGVSLELRLPESIAVMGVRRLLLECLSCLLDNAIRYTPAGGKVEVAGGDGAHPWVAIADTGIGIAEQHVQRIFERFYRVDSTRSGGEGGSGLGLPIALEIARLHGAAIAVESRPGRGSRFTLEFRREGGATG